MSLTFGEARSRYANQASIRSVHTRDAYLRSIDLFLTYLSDRKFTRRLPVQAYMMPSAEECLLEKLAMEDESILQCFAEWLQTPGEGDKRPYALSTVELRLAGVQRWFEFIEAQGWLPEGFSLKRAIELSRNRSKNRVEISKKVTVIQDLSPLIAYYDRQKPPKQYKPDTERYWRWELTRLRNAALLKTLAETGGQISAILKLNTDIFIGNDATVTIRVDGKSGYSYQATLQESLPAIRRYLSQRQLDLAKAAETPVFVSHDSGYEGKRMSRIIAWRIVQRAAKATGLPSVSPHDLRHWRAQQLIEAGHSLEEIQTMLGHRSIHTVRIYYGHLKNDAPSEDQASDPL